jgi:hypothetical protein
MNGLNSAAGVPRFASALALCPVVDLPTSAKQLFSAGIKGQFAAAFFMDVLNAILAVPRLAGFFPDTNPEQIPDEAATAAADHLATLPRRWFMAPFQNTRIQTREQFWDAHRFFDLARKGTAVPTLAFASANDWVVETAYNSGRMAPILPAGGNLNVVVAERGNHCAFNMAYGWETATEIFRSYVLSRSPELLARHRTRRAFIDPAWFESEFAIDPGQAYSRFEFSAEAASPNLDLAVWVWDPRLNSPCTSPYETVRSCVTSHHYTIPLDRLIGASWAQTPATDTDAEALTRAANANLHLLDAQGRPSLGGTQTPVGIFWDSYEN